MAQDLDGKVAIVTGGASGIGLETARRLLAAGARVAIGDLNAEAGAKAVADLGAGPDRLRFVAGDVAVEADVERLVAEAVAAFGRLDIMFNNAGLGGAIGPITEIGYDDWRRTFDILVGGVFLGTKHAVRQMLKQGQGGAIVNTASIAGMSGGGGPPAYSCAKAAVINLTQNNAVELAKHHIRVNAICPGVIFTPLYHGGDIEDGTQAIQGIQPWPEKGEPANIADTVLFLCSPGAGFITGQAIVVDGGMSAGGPRFSMAQKRNRAATKVAGFAAGSTGQPSTIRRLEPR